MLGDMEGKKEEEGAGFNPEQTIKYWKRQEAGWLESSCLVIFSESGVIVLNPHGACVCGAKGCFSVLGVYYEENEMVSPQF